MIRLEKVNGNNVWDLLKLRVSEEQKNIVADNDISIIEAYTAITGNGYVFPFGIYPSWDAQNMNSVRLAEKLGYEFDHEYTAYEVSGEDRTH